ncbi:uncharacterized protein At1g51745 isoform X1 [Dendrobium catenatum]|uniref:uncharacterized protein At1g51745 isoform X2 n=1 Tax=Dendrobium catenatum TaxID=906689 RepID=UPI0009F6DF9E|nr:uncharacterized protein At1g51745 isoform X2 [Dendrobium catenatum]XP_020683944.1 uncharacterized protein At1g51745 isoform X3 [Dendrobium catenatum]XP_020683950.1 uncharacterized protein At1g51745 isoform X2 [Dendrobium catenatum]XP_028549539.1 uncharacterized protein At1g51745 isoform X1 [Dendrobium catenatum]XP_028549540.1 uncharacterized protein At1g51745 isoform X1 [Dendrobium catenatum]XP_028549542.1 uncharacterized protein At1g51745 isoform X1 [Dendrobium catenatum]
MESLQEDDLKGMNASAGGLVWVRRRNGSWWPGRILCVDELAKCLRTKKAGTPVKLLGREEGTVDWYNLEKSKRIKAFRCGEYDDCIARAKASAIRSNRRTADSGKYARRVDAILHALELEKCHLTSGNSSKVSCIAEDSLKQKKIMFKNRREIVFTARKSGKPKEIYTHELSHSVALFERSEQPLNSAVHKKRRKNPNDSEDDGDEGIRRMKDLQDLSLGMVSTGKPNVRASMKETCAKGSSGRASQNEPDFDNNSSSISHRSSFKNSCLSSKTTRLFHVCQNLKRRNRRRRRLTKIWVGSDSVKVNVPLIYQDSVITGDLPSYGITMKRLNDLKSSSKKKKFSLMDTSSLDCSESSYERTSLHAQEKNGTAVYDLNPPSVVRDDADDNNLSNGLVNVPILIGERNVEGVLPICKTRASRKNHSYLSEKLSVHSVQVCMVSKAGEGLVEASSTNSVSPANHIAQRLKKNNIGLNSKVRGHSKYSSLNMNLNSVSSDDEAENACDGSLTSDISDQSVRSGSLTELSNFHEAQTILASSATANDFPCIYKSLQSGNNLQCSYSTSSAQLKGALREVFTSTMQVQDSDKREQSLVSISPRCAVLELSNSASVASLYEVELKVQANYHGQRAPLVSLVSKLDGKAIVGHAIAVEILGDGSSAALLNSSINFLRNRVNIICKLSEKLNDLKKSELSVHETSHLSCTNSPLLERRSLVGRNLSCKNSSLLKRKPLCGRRSGFSPRKIRRLSSITVDLNSKDNVREIIVEKVEPLFVCCIPLRVVFGRLHEALGCSSQPAK